MASFFTEKVVSALPAVPVTPNTIFFVRTGVGFDLYLSDSTGLIIRSLNQSQNTWFIGRANLTANTWYGPANGLGVIDGKFATSYGTAANPSVSWNSRGLPCLQDDLIERWDIIGRVNNATVTNVECRLYHLTGPLAGGWSSNVTSTITLASTITIVFGAVERRSGSSIVPYTVPADGVLVPVFRPGAVSGNRKMFFESRITFKR